MTLLSARPQPARPDRPPPPDRDALARVAAISRRRRTDVTVHVGAVMLILSGVLSPIGTALAEGVACRSTCEVATAASPVVTAASRNRSSAAGAAYAAPPPASRSAAAATGTGTRPVVRPTATATAPALTAALPATVPAAPPAPTTTPTTAPAPVTAGPITAGPPATSALSGTAAPPLAVPSADEGVTAARTLGWGAPTRTDEFGGDLSAWGLYDGPGHAGQGIRSPSAMSVANGALTVSGDANGTTGGMEWGAGERYGRWEGRVRAPASDPTYNALLLLWPDAENWPRGGEIDFMEMSDHTRQETEAFLHYGPDEAHDSQVSGAVTVDATQWHNWAVEWTPDHITTFVDGVPWFTTTSAVVQPPGPMHLCIQLDWFPEEGNSTSTVTPSTMNVDWVRYYPYPG